MDEAKEEFGGKPLVLNLLDLTDRSFRLIVIEYVATSICCFEDAAVIDKCRISSVGGKSRQGAWLAKKTFSTYLEPSQRVGRHRSSVREMASGIAGSTAIEIDGRLPYLCQARQGRNL